MNMIEKNASAASYFASGSIVVFGMSMSDFALLIGGVSAVLTALVNWYYKARADKRAERKAQHDLKD